MVQGSRYLLRPEPVVVFPCSPFVYIYSYIYINIHTHICTYRHTYLLTLNSPVVSAVTWEPHAQAIFDFM